MCREHKIHSYHYRSHTALCAHQENKTFYTVSITSKVYCNYLEQTGRNLKNQKPCTIYSHQLEASGICLKGSMYLFTSYYKFNLVNST